MKKTLNYQNNLTLENTISEITSISLECSYEEYSNKLDGKFEVEGSYKSFEAFEDELNFTYSLPFEEEIEDHVEDSLKVEILDFNYEIDSNILIINIDYQILYDEVVDEEDKEIEEFLEEHRIEPEDINIVEEVQEDNIDANVILNNISDEENYITYHVHVCDESDSLETITTKYNITKDDVLEYNNLEDIRAGEKIILPIKDE